MLRYNCVAEKVNGVKSVLLCSQGDPPDLWQTLLEMEFSFGLIPVVAVVEALLVMVTEQGRIPRRFPGVHYISVKCHSCYESELQDSNEIESLKKHLIDLVNQGNFSGESS